MVDTYIPFKSPDAFYKYLEDVDNCSNEGCLKFYGSFFFEIENLVLGENYQKCMRKNSKIEKC